MPIFDLKCTSCDHEFESLCSSEKLTPCPVCGAPTEQAISTFGGYTISGNNSASTRPKGAGSRREKKQ